MKLKLNESGEYKLKLNPYEMETIVGVLEHVRLGQGERSDVVFELLSKLDSIKNNSCEDFGSWSDIDTNNVNVQVTTESGGDFTIELYDF